MNIMLRKMEKQEFDKKNVSYSCITYILVIYFFTRKFSKTIQLPYIADKNSTVSNAA